MIRAHNPNIMIFHQCTGEPWCFTIIGNVKVEIFSSPRLSSDIEVGFFRYSSGTDDNPLTLALYNL